MRCFLAGNIFLRTAKEKKILSTAIEASISPRQPITFRERVIESAFDLETPRVF